MALVDMSKVEQRYRAVLAVQAGERVGEVAMRFGVSRQSVSTWLSRYADEGLAGLSDRSHRPESCPHQASPEVEAAVCELRRAHPRWGPLRIEFELGRDGCPGPVPSRMTVYRILVRHGLIVAGDAAAGSSGLHPVAAGPADGVVADGHRRRCDPCRRPGGQGRHRCR